MCECGCVLIVLSMLFDYFEDCISIGRSRSNTNEDGMKIEIFDHTRTCGYVSQRAKDSLREVRRHPRVVTPMRSNSSTSDSSMCASARFRAV